MARSHPGPRVSEGLGEPLGSGFQSSQVNCVPVSSDSPEPGSGHWAGSSSPSVPRPQAPTLWQGTGGGRDPGQYQSWRRQGDRPGAGAQGDTHPRGPSLRLSPRAPLPARQRPVARLPLAPARPGGTAGPLSAVPQFCVSAQGHARGDRRVTFRCASAPPRPATCPWTPRPLRVSAAAGGAALSVGARLFTSEFLFSLKEHPEAGLLGQATALALIFSRSPPSKSRFLWWLLPLTFLPTVPEGPSLPLRTLPRARAC